MSCSIVGGQCDVERRCKEIYYSEYGTCVKSESMNVSLRVKRERLISEDELDIT